MPTSSANKNPDETRNSDATTYLPSTPRCASSTMPVTTWFGFGKIVVPDKLTATYHSAINNAATDSGNMIDPSLRFMLFLSVPGIRLGVVSSLGEGRVGVVFKPDRAAEN